MGWGVGEKEGNLNCNAERRVDGFWGTRRGKMTKGKEGEGEDRGREEEIEREVERARGTRYTKEEQAKRKVREGRKERRGRQKTQEEEKEGGEGGEKEEDESKEEEEEEKEILRRKSIEEIVKGFDGKGGHVIEFGTIYLNRIDSLSNIQ